MAKKQLFKIEVAEMEDKVINPLNSILLLSYGLKEGPKIAHEVDRIVRYLEAVGLIHPRRRL